MLKASQAKQHPARPQEEVGRLALYRQVSEALNSSLILDDIFENLADVLQSAIPFTQACLVLLDDTQNRVRLAVYFDEEGGLELSAEDTRFSGNDPLLKQLLQKPEAKLHDWLAKENSLLLPPVAGHALLGGLVNKGVVVGMMALFRETSPSSASNAENLQPCFDADDVQLFEDISTSLALALENARFYIQSQSQASREFLINQLTRAISQSLEVETILETAVRELGQVLGVSRCYVQYFDQPLNVSQGLEVNQAVTGRLFCYQQAGVSPLQTETASQNVTNTTLSFSTVEAKAIALRQSAPKANHAGHINSLEYSAERPALLNPFVLDDTESAPPELNLTTYFADNAIRSLMIIPIQGQQGLVGCLTLHQCNTLRSWLSNELELLLAIAEQLSVALNQARLFRAIAQQKEALESTVFELQQAQMQLIQSEKMAVLGQFVAGIAHEVNTPLGSMMSNHGTLAQCLRQFAGDWPQLAAALDSIAFSLPASCQPKRFTMMLQLLDMNEMAGERIRDIVKNLRNFARLDESEQKAVDLHEGLESTLMLVRSSLPVKMKVERHYNNALPLVVCYPGLLNQVFMNMMVNAIHATQGLPQPLLTLATGSVLGNPNLVEVCISDNGSGISEANLAKIFDPGFTTKSQGVGTGLGLALCYRIIEKHNGRIEVTSSPKQGTLFRLVLPVAGPSSTAT